MGFNQDAEGAAIPGACEIQMMVPDVENCSGSLMAVLKMADSFTTWCLGHLELHCRGPRPAPLAAKIVSSRCLSGDQDNRYVENLLLGDTFQPCHRLWES